MAKIHNRAHNPEAVVADVGAHLKLEPHGLLENEARQLLLLAQQQINQPVATAP